MHRTPFHHIHRQEEECTKWEKCVTKTNILFLWPITISPPTTRWEYLLNGLIYTCRDIVHPLPPSDTSEITLWPLWGWTFLFYLGTLVEVWEVCRLSFRLLLGIQSQPQQCNKSPKEERPRKRVAHRQPQGIRWTMGK